jgi:hypothetical protein
MDHGFMLLLWLVAADWKCSMRVRWHVRYAPMFAGLASLPPSASIWATNRYPCLGPAGLAYLWSQVSGDRREIAPLDGASQPRLPSPELTFYRVCGTPENREERTFDRPI